jgi:5-methylcytosine-specific restriction endonuclease McrA
MKRPGLPPRHAWIRRRTTPSSGGTPRTRRPIKKVNATRKAKKAAKYKAFLSSGVWKRLRREALERAGHQCEFTIATFDRSAVGRCMATEKLTVHHRRYGWRFGGNELPEDLQVLCKDCHNALHARQGKVVA